MPYLTFAPSKRILVATVGAACLLMAGCGGGDDSTPTPTATPTPTPTPTPGTGACDMTGNIFSVAGNTAQMNNNIYKADGNTIEMTQTHSMVVNGGTSFNGVNGLIELAQTSNVTSGTGSGTTALTKTYYSFGPVESRSYGLTNASTVMGMAINATVTFTPAMIWPTNPTLGTPYSNTYTINTSTMGVNSSMTQTEVRTYSEEQITTLAGTYAACKYKSDVTSNGATSTTYTWNVGSGRLKGHLLMQKSGAGVRTMEATQLTVNGS